MKKLFVYIVDVAHDKAAESIAGDTPLGHLKRAFPSAPVIARRSEIGEIPLVEYIAIVPSTMPLVTEESLLAVADEMDKRRLPAIEIGEGLISERAALTGGAAPKHTFRAEAFRVIETKSDLYAAERALYLKNAELCVKNGAIIPDESSVRIDVKSLVEAGATVMPYVTVSGSRIASGARIESFSIVENSVIGAGASVLCSVVRDSTIGKGTTVGPYAYVRMNSAIGDGCRIGDFVEVKRSLVADGTKAAHLTYIGDAEIGVGTNVGCGTVFANYDGKRKHKTKVGNHAFIGANTNLIAPLNVGDDAYIAAATTVTEDVPEGGFVIGRTRAEIKKRTK